MTDTHPGWPTPHAQATRLNGLAENYGPKGFVALGVNLDAKQEGTVDPKQVSGAVRRYLIAHGVSWPNLLNGAGDQDFAKAYNVAEIPADFLVGRAGTIDQFELDEANLEGVVSAALAAGAAPKR